MMVVGAIVLIVVVAALAYVGVAALWEHNAERALHCSRCRRSGPFPERVMMTRRRGQPARCPDCGTPLVRQEASRSDRSDM